MQARVCRSEVLPKVHLHFEAIAKDVDAEGSVAKNSRVPNLHSQMRWQVKIETDCE